MMKQNTVILSIQEYDRLKTLEYEDKNRYAHSIIIHTAGIGINQRIYTNDEAVKEIALQLKTVHEKHAAMLFRLRLEDHIDEIELMNPRKTSIWKFIKLKYFNS